MEEKRRSNADRQAVDGRDQGFSKSASRLRSGRRGRPVAPAGRGDR